MYRRQERLLPREDSLKRIKLVISDFHIGRGRWLEDGSLNPLEQFIYDEKFIQFLEYYSTGDFHKAEVELIINGDFLNTIQVDYDEVLPDALTERGSMEKVKRIVRGHPEIFESLRKFVKAPHHTITYIYGNHEPGLLWQSVRKYFESVLEERINWPGFNYSFDGIYIEHGNQYHTLNRFDPDQLFLSRGMKEPIVNIPWGTYFVIKFLNRLKLKRPHIDRVQPFGRYLLAAIFFDTGFAISALFRLANFVLHRHIEWYPGQENPLITSVNILRDTTIIPDMGTYAQQVLKKGQYHTVIFGHSHQAAFRKIGQAQLYVNTGTWNDIIHLDIQNLGRQRRMTYAYIEYDSKGRPQTRLKIWKGTRLVEEDVIF